MEYADSLRDLLIRKITKAEQDVVQLKLDYCRFVYGLTHRSQVRFNHQVYQVRSVDVEGMQRDEEGRFSRPVITGIMLGAEDSEEVALGTDWELVSG